MKNKVYFLGAALLLALCVGAHADEYTSIVYSTNNLTVDEMLLTLDDLDYNATLAAGGDLRVNLNGIPLKEWSRQSRDSALSTVLGAALYCGGLETHPTGKEKTLGSAFCQSFVSRQLFYVYSVLLDRNLEEMRNESEDLGRRVLVDEQTLIDTVPEVFCKNRIRVYSPLVVRCFGDTSYEYLGGTLYPLGVFNLTTPGYSNKIKAKLTWTYVLDLEGQEGFFRVDDYPFYTVYRDGVRIAGFYRSGQIGNLSYVDEGAGKGLHVYRVTARVGSRTVSSRDVRINVLY